MNKDEVAIIIPVFNSEKYIEKCLLSLINQDYKKIFPIIIDNNSQDNSIQIAKRILNSCSLRYKILQEKQQGVSFARNKGIKESNSQYICFLDPDDYLTPDSISSRVQEIKKTRLYVTFGRYTRFNEKNKNQEDFTPPKNINLNNIFYRNYIGNLTGLYDCSKLGKFFQEPIGHEDYEMWIRIIKKSKNSSGVIEKSIGYYRINEKSLSSNKIKSCLWHYRVLKKHVPNFFKLHLYFITYVIYHLKKIILK